MSEESNEAAESAEIAQSAVETESSPPPWGDDFNPERAWQTITHLRDREKELEKDAKAWTRFREDEEFRRQNLNELGYEFEEEPEDDDEYEEEEAKPLQDPRVDTILQRLQTEDYNRDLTKFAGDRELSKQAKDWIQQETFRTGANPQALEKAVNAWVEFEDGLRETAKRERSKPPTPPAAPQAGRSGEQQFDRKSATPAQRKAEREARIAALHAAETQGQ